MSGPIRVILGKVSESEAYLQLKGPDEESVSHTFLLPWLDEIEWQAVFLSLELHEEDTKTWPTKAEVLGKARSLGFFDNRPSKERFKIIGQQLYNSTFHLDESKQQLERLLHINDGIPVVEFHIPDEGSILQAYPWELLHNGNEFLFDGTHAFPVRHVDFDERNTPFQLTEFLRVLYVAPRPDMSSYQSYANLPIFEKLQLEYLSRNYSNNLALESLPSNSLDTLQKHLIRPENPFHIVHIDTHGDFGWLCKCKRLNHSTTSQCVQCGKAKAKENKIQGYLAFETNSKDVEWVSGEELGKRLHQREIQVVVLTACRSGLVGGSSSFNSVAGALVKNRIPAVVAMQNSITVSQAEKFVDFFYWPLIKGMPLTQAVAEVRIAFNDSWYRPVLYLRTDSNNFRGKLFEQKSSLELPDKRPPDKRTRREKWIERLGFKRDPFLYTDGEKDPYLQEYFYVHMRHFQDISDLSREEAVFVFGPPGSGKSSIRNVISQLYRNANILPIVYKDFGPLVRKHRNGEKIAIEDHVTLILQTALRTLTELEIVAEKEDSPLQEPEERKIIRNQLWSYVNNYEKDPRRWYFLKSLLNPESNSEVALPNDARELLGRFCRYVTEFFGYKFIYILIDPESWVDMLESLLSERRLLELSEDNVSFKIFLSQDIQERVLQIPWIEQERSRRFFNIEWPDEELLDLLRVRLSNSSEGRYKSLGQLSEVENLDDRVIRLSRGSPRELIVICNRLFSEHCRKWSPDNEEPFFITEYEVNKVLKPFEERLPKSPIEILILQGETEQLEFKSTMRINLKTGTRDRDIERAIAKTICAFMNTEGGTLLIGVDDNGSILGLDKDFSILGKRQNKDGFHQAFVEITEDMFDPPLLPDDYKANFIELEGKLIYIVEVNKSTRAVYCSFDGAADFYVRKQTTTRKLDAKASNEYCSNHFT